MVEETLQIKLLKLKALYGLRCNFPTIERQLNIKHIKDLEIFNSKPPSKKSIYLAITDYESCLIDNHPYRSVSLREICKAPGEEAARKALGWVPTKDTLLFFPKVGRVMYHGSAAAYLDLPPYGYVYYFKAAEFNISWFLFREGRGGARQCI